MTTFSLEVELPSESYTPILHVTTPLSPYIISLSVAVVLVVVTSVEEVVVLVHYEQTGTAKIRVVDNHQVLQKQVLLVQHIQSSSDQKAQDQVEIMVIMAAQPHLMI